MTDTDPPVGALDIGSNTVRMLVARPLAGALERVLDMGVYARLGQGVDSTGMLAEDTMNRAAKSIVRFVRQAREAGVEEIMAVATSAIRDASNGPDFAERLRREAGIEPEIISGDREAELTFIGATLGRRLEQETLVVDLGGGSGEIIIAEGTAPKWGHALQIGSRRLTERFVRTDPPEQSDLDALAQHVRSLLEELPAASPQAGIFAGGTAKALPAVLRMSGAPIVLSRSQLDQICGILLQSTAEDITGRFDLPSERAQVLAAGAATLATIATFYVLDEVAISATGIREGMIIDMLRKQGRWTNPM
jgi:exopolyphosphatase/guanosine-5'-triphosphate,3'-diphosphate pyrophosphatase